MPPRKALMLRIDFLVTVKPEDEDWAKDQLIQDVAMQAKDLLPPDDIKVLGVWAGTSVAARQIVEEE